MRRLGYRRCPTVALGAFALGAWLAAPPLAFGQASPPLRVFDVPFDQPVVAVMLPAGGYLRVTGAAISTLDGTVYDAANTTAPTGATSRGGLVEEAAGGLVLAESDPAAHSYTYHASGLVGPACDAVLLGQTCIVLRLPELAAARLRDLDELREELTGRVQVEVHGPPAAGYLPPPPYGYGSAPLPWPEPEPAGLPAWIWAVGAGSTAGLVGALVALGLVLRRRRSASPIARVQAAASRLHQRLEGDSVRSRLLAVVHELAAEAESLNTLAAKLGAAVKDARPEEIERRRDQLRRKAGELGARGGDEAGKGELESAVRILDGQLERCRRWERQQWRAGARLERIATRLEALEVELNDPTAGNRGDEHKLLDALQEELELARDGEQEAEGLLGPRTGGEAS